MTAASAPLAGALQLLDFALHQVAFEGADVADVELAIEVIGLVQEGARQQVLAGFFKLFSLGVLGAYGDAFAPAHLFAEAGYAEAAFLAILFALHVDDGGIDENEFLFRALAVGTVDDGDLAAEADLRGGQADTLGGVHRLEHVFEELVEFGIIELLDLVGFALQHRVAEFDYGVD